MFLKQLLRRNSVLALEAGRLHQSGRIRANTYLLDVDSMVANAYVFRRSANALGLQTYFMAKQFGYNPDACRALIEAGMPSAVCVDVQGLEAHRRNGIAVGHVGHLVQPQRGSEDVIMAAQPEVVTVFSIDIARRLSEAARRAETVQAVLLRVQAPGDIFYFGHGGGFPLEEVEVAADAIQRLGDLRVAGVTTFPCLLGNPSTRTVELTPNMVTLAAATARLRAAGYSITQVNAPGTNTAQTIAAVAREGATHVEPGNALHGTTPMQVFDSDAPERPAIVYISEVSHLDGDDAYVFAAGYYADKVLGEYQLRALVGHDDSLLEREVDVDTAPDGAIHYYAIIRAARPAGVQVGDSVVFCFRPQTFVTRGRTQAIAGLHSGTIADLRASYDQEARPTDGIS